MEITVHIVWREVGTIGLDAGGRLAFPPLPRSSGVYRIT